LEQKECASIDELLADFPILCLLYCIALLTFLPFFFFFLTCEFELL